MAVEKTGGRPWLLDVTAVAADRYVTDTPRDDQSHVGLGAHIHDLDRVIDAAAALHMADPEAGWDPETEARDSYGKSIVTGRLQQFRLLDAGTRVVSPGESPDGVAELLRGSYAMGALFGTITDKPPDDPSWRVADALGMPSVSHEVLDEITADPPKYLERQQARIHYTEEGLNLIKSRVRRGLGCPALREVVRLSDETRVTVYRASWTRTTEDFIRRHVVSGTPFDYDLVRPATPTPQTDPNFYAKYG